MKDTKYDQQEMGGIQEGLINNLSKSGHSSLIFTKEVKKSYTKVNKRPFSPSPIQNDWMMLNIDTQAPYGRIANFVKEILNHPTLRKSKSINTHELKSLNQTVDKDYNEKYQNKNLTNKTTKIKVSLKEKSEVNISEKALKKPDNKSNGGPNKIHISIENKRENVSTPNNLKSTHYSTLQQNSKFNSKGKNSPNDLPLNAIKGISFAKSPTNRLLKRPESQESYKKKESINYSLSNENKGTDKVSIYKKSKFGPLEDHMKKLASITGKFNKKCNTGIQKNLHKNGNVSLSQSISKDDENNLKSKESIKQQFYKIQESAATLIQKAFRKYRNPLSIQLKSKL